MFNPCKEQLYISLCKRDGHGTRPPSIRDCSLSSVRCRSCRRSTGKKGHAWSKGPWSKPPPWGGSIGCAGCAASRTPARHAAQDCSWRGLCCGKQSRLLVASLTLTPGWARNQSSSGFACLPAAHSASGMLDGLVVAMLKASRQPCGSMCSGQTAACLPATTCSHPPHTAEVDQAYRQMSHERKHPHTPSVPHPCAQTHAAVDHGPPCMPGWSRWPPSDGQREARQQGAAPAIRQPALTWPMQARWPGC